MALIKCPECGHDVSSEAKNCPNCGYPIAEKISASKQQTIVSDDEKQVNTNNETIIKSKQEASTESTDQTVKEEKQERSHMMMQLLPHFMI